MVWDYLSKEVSLRRVIGPIHPAVLPAGTQVSPFGVIPKSSLPGKWQLIVDLSSATNKSVNDGIDPELCSVHYLRLDEVLEAVVQCGRGFFLPKMDIEGAYRMVPVHPHDSDAVGRSGVVRHKTAIWASRYLLLWPTPSNGCSRNMESLWWSIISMTTSL